MRRVCLLSMMVSVVLIELEVDGRSEKTVFWCEKMISDVGLYWMLWFGIMVELELLLLLLLWLRLLSFDWLDCSHAEIILRTRGNAVATKQEHLVVDVG